MNTKATLTGAAIALAVIVIAVAVWLFLPTKKSIANDPMIKGEEVIATNPNLNVRYSYDNAFFTPASYDPRAEYPLRLDGSNFSFYGKRIRGLGALLAKDPNGMLYDFVGVTHLENLEQYYNLSPMGEPVYEDAQIGGKLGLHQKAQYKFGADSQWPYYFPTMFDTNPPPTTCFVEGWAVFTDQDLFFFQTVSMEMLTTEQRLACQQVMDSLEFNAVLGDDEQEPSASEEDEISSVADEQEELPLPVEGQ